MYQAWISKADKVMYSIKTKEYTHIFVSYLMVFYLLVYINFGALMCQRKQQMHCCSTGSLDPVTGHFVPIAAIGIFPRRLAID